MGPIRRSPNTLPFLSPTVELRQTWLHPPPEIPVPAALPSLPQSSVRGLVPPTPLSPARANRPSAGATRGPPYTAPSPHPPHAELCLTLPQLQPTHAAPSSARSLPGPSSASACSTPSRTLPPPMPVVPPPNPTPPELVTGSKELRGEKMVLEGA